MRRSRSTLTLALIAACSQHPQIEVVPVACEVVVGPDLFTLSPVLAPEVFEPGNQFSRNARGTIYTGATSGGVVLAYNGQGGLSGTIGSPGDGPGELARGHVIVFVGPGDTLFVRDNHRHWVVFDSDHKFVGNRDLGPISALSPADTYFLPDGRVLSSFVMPTVAPNSIAIVDSRGMVVRAFAPLPPSASPSTPRPRVSAYVGNGQLWVAPEAGPRDGYLIEVWDTTGTHLASIRRDVDWFPPQPSFAPRYTEGDGPRSFPFPTIARIVPDEAGLVWVFSVVPKVPHARRAYQRAAFDNLDQVRRDVLDFVVEVFDVATRQVVASGRLSRSDKSFDGPLLSGRWAYRVDEDSTGARTVRVLQLGFRARAGQNCQL